MSGSGEYTTTPNLGLFKPTYNADAENWGFHLNSNSDTIDATLAGGGIYTATGGTTPRSAADRAADVANVLDFGADPTGVEDSSAAINAAAAVVGPNGRYKTVYLPTGTYRVNRQINLTTSQGLIGNTRGSTILKVDQAFSSTDVAVIFTTSGGMDEGPVIRDLQIQFTQPQTPFTRAGMLTLAAGGTAAAGGTGIKYPWAIAAGSEAYRCQIIRVRISGAWDGITTNGHNAVYWLEAVEVGAVDCGLSMGEGTNGVLDFAHINGYAFWCWGFNFSTSPFNDGQTIGMRLGNQNGLDARGVSLFVGQLVFTSQAALGWFDFTNLALDSDHSVMTVNGASWLKISNLYTTSGSSGLGPAVAVLAGDVTISGWHAHTASGFQTLSVLGGDVTVIGAKLTRGDTTGSAVAITGGRLRMVGVKIFPQTNFAYAAPLINQGGTGVLQLDDIDMVGDPASSGTALVINNDNVGNSIGAIMLGPNWTINIPSAFSVGRYGLVAASGGNMTGPLDIQTAPVATTTQLRLAGYTGANGALGKLWMAGSFPSGSDYGSYVSASLRAGWNALSWTGSYLQVWLTNSANSPASDAHQVMVANFTSDGLQLPTLATSTSYANDAAAAAGGVPIGKLYRNGSNMMIRVT